MPGVARLESRTRLIRSAAVRNAGSAAGMAALCCMPAIMRRGIICRSRADVACILQHAPSSAPPARPPPRGSAGLSLRQRGPTPGCGSRIAYEDKEARPSSLNVVGDAMTVRCQGRDVYRWNCSIVSPHEPARDPIPRVVHTSWKRCSLPHMQTQFRSLCQHMLPGFQFYHWDDEGNDSLVRHFPAYYATYRNYDQVIKKVDAVRFFSLYHVGGTYMDTDMACLRPFPPWLTNTTDVVLGVAAGQADFVPNAFMAAPRKHPFVAFLIQQLKYTSKHTRSVFATAGPAFLSAAVKWWKANVGTGLTLLPFEVLYADSSAKHTCSISEARIEADVRTCSESLPKSWVYSISAGTWCLVVRAAGRSRGLTSRAPAYSNDTSDCSISDASRYCLFIAPYPGSR